MADQVGDKSFDPTPHRRQQARQEGHVAKSHDLCSAGMLLLGLAVLMMFGGGLVGFLVEYCRQQLGGEAWLVADSDFAVRHWSATIWELGRYLLPILGLFCLAGIVVHVVQAGFLFLPQKLAIDPARISPFQGLQRIISPGNAVRLGFGVLKIAVVSAIAGIVIYGQREAIVQLTVLPVPQLALQLTQILFWTTVKIGAALLTLAVFDYAYQWWKHEQELKMTPQELREELRNLEGNPQVIARRKRLQREPAENRGTSLAAQADVILTDPAGLAIAIRYDPDTMPAPTVLAKGTGVAAGRIRESAEQRRIAAIENPALTQSLYRSAAVNRPIPPEYYTAVAEVLAEVYSEESLFRT
jgi:flagellar biosynthetic protein FlhB